MPEPIKIGLLGLGNIGAGVIRALDTHGETIGRRTARPLEIVAIADKDLETRRDTGGSAYRE